MFLERAITAAIIFAGFTLFFLVMPGQVEEVDYGRIIPSTVPSIAIWIIIAVAAVQIVQSRHSIHLDIAVCLKAAAFLCFLVFAAYAMERFGFEFVAPVLALVVIFVIGERRWHWLLLGGVVIPVGVWVNVERLLDRVLA
jgi:putative tricarboxylic transport membrane protein